MQSKRHTINPYLMGFNLIYHRFLWDINPLSWISRRRLKTFKNQYMGKKAIILCNGPSLKKVNFDELSKHRVFTFGLNKINLLFSSTEFRPSCIVAVNPFVIEQNVGFYNSTKLPLFIDSQSFKIVKFRNNINFLYSREIKSCFARDCSNSINQGYTVTYVAMQLAFHMGFKQVALVGCDHHFNRTGPANRTITSAGPDSDHFDVNYFRQGMNCERNI
jgi:hypothetical protein